jgi:hypothetical protein
LIPPKLNLDLKFIREYYRNNELGQRDMDLIVEESMEAEVVDED